MNLFKKFIPIVQKGKPGGVAILDASGHLEWSELPDGLSGGMSYQGLLDASAGSYPLVPVNHAAPIASGDYWKVSVGGNLVGSHGIKKSITKAETSGGGLDTKFTCASHGYHNADVIWISGTTSYNGLRTVSSVTANTFIVTGLAFVANETGYAQETETTTWVAGDLCIWNNLSWDKMSDADLPVIIPFNHAYYVDGSRVDPYTEDGSISRPYKKLKTCLDAINIDSAAKMAAADYDSTKYIVKVMPGTYSDALTILSAKYLRIELDGVKLSGAITAILNHASPLSPGGDYYSKLEFVGGRGNRANRGEQAWISSDITFSRNDASLQYVTFAGVNLTGNLGFTSDGVWVVYMENSYHNDNTKYFHTTGNAKVLLETYGYNFLKCNFTKLSDVASASDISFYDCNETTFYVINSTPFYDCWFKNCLFSAAASLVSANTLKIDANSLVSLRAQTPTLTGMALTQLDEEPLFKNTTDAVGATWDVYKSRGKYGTPLSVQTGDNVYTQNFWLHDGTNYLNMAGIEVEAAGTIAATQTPTNMIFKVATDTTPSVKSNALKIWYNLRAQFYGEIHSSTNTQINAMYDDNQATYRTKLTLWNSSTATAGVPNQYAPSLNFLGHVWNTTGAGSDETSEWRMGMRVVSGLAPYSVYYLRQSQNGAAYAEKYNINSLGVSSQYANSTDTVSAGLAFYKSRGTNATPLTIVTGDYLGELVGYGHDGTNYIRSASIRFISTGTVLGTRIPSKIQFYGSTDATPSVETLWFDMGNINGTRNYSYLPLYISNAIVYDYRNGITTTSTDAYVATNETTALVGTPVQMSPRARFRGSAWETTGGSSQTVDCISELLPVSGATASGIYRIGFSINGGLYTYPFTFTSGGVLTTTSNINCGGQILLGGGNTIANSSTTDRGQITIGYTTGSTSISRNTADAYATFVIDNRHASSTGNILSLQWQSINRVWWTPLGNEYKTMNSDDTVGSQINWQKSRGTLASPTICVSGDNAGALYGWHHDGANYLNTSKILLTSYSVAIGATRIGGVFEVWLRPDTGGGTLTKYFDIASNGSTTVNGKFYSTQRGYAEMYMYDNVTACVIDNANVYHAVYNSFGNNDGTLAPVIDTTEWTYKAGVGYTITSVTDPGGGTTITCVTAGHALLAGEPITITNSTNYNGTYLVLAAGLTATEFRVTKAFAGNDTGSVRRPATLKCLVAGNYYAGFDLGGVTVSANDIIKFELNKDTTPLDNIGRKVEWTTNNRGANAHGNVSLTAGQYIWLSVKNTSGTGDLTISSANVHVQRL